MPAPDTLTSRGARADGGPTGAVAPDAGGVLGDVTVTDVPMRPLASVVSAWRARRLLVPLGARILQKFILNTKLGRWWLIVRPLMDTVGMSLLFGVMLKVPTPRGVPYVLFLVTGLLGWRLFERSMMYTTRSFGVYRKMMKTFKLPLLLVPLAGMAYPLFEWAFCWVVLAVALIVYWLLEGTFHLQGLPQLLWVLPALGLLFLLTVGASLWVSVLNAKARDVRFTIRYVMPVWMFLTPVVYPAANMPDGFSWLAVVNPMAAPVELMKTGLLGAGEVIPAAIGCSLGTGLLVTAGGLWFFCREAARSIEASEEHEDAEE